MLAMIWEKQNPYTLLGDCKLVQPLWKTVWRLLRKLKKDCCMINNTTPRDIPEGM
jgi:hypothetical protein